MTEQEMLAKIESHKGLWVHTNGDRYRVIKILNRYAEDCRRDEYPLLVEYEGTDGRVWAKSPEGFLRSRTEVHDL